MSEKKSPFKFLDYYDRDDTDIFFGREDEEMTMYQLVRKNRFVLIYGPSGSGKTSLVQCGLAKQFDPSEWMPFYIRRGNNINISLLNELKSKYDVDINPYDLKNAVTHLKKIIETIRIRDLRPIYLIFDQFEELLILGNERERTTFKELLREIVEQHSIMSTNVVILMREEYFAWLDSFEKDLQGISENRLRVEPMRADEVKKVIKKSCTAFHITFENEERNTSQIINVLSGKNSISLPYLQVYLDQLWKTVEAKNPTARRSNGFPELTFTTSEINAFGNFKDVLFRFLKQQSEKIQKEVMKEFPDEAEDCIANILDSFVSPEGTKLPIAYSHIRNAYKLDNKAPNYLQALRPRVLKFALDKLEDYRILRDDGTTFELAHDALSKLIDSQRDSNRRRINEIRMEIHKAFESWSKDPKEFLSYKKVKEYETVIPSLSLDKAQLEFFNKSKEFREDEELEKLKSVRKFNRLKFMAMFLGGLLLIFILVGNYLLNKGNTDFALVKMAYTVDTMANKEIALKLANHIYDFKDYNKEDELSLQAKIKKIAMDQSIQSLFAIYPTNTLVKKVFGKGEADISSNGEYIYIKEDDASKIFHNGKLDTSFRQVSYGYFMNKDNVILLASNSPKKSTVSTGMATYANYFTLYDCKERKAIKTVDLSDRSGFLYYPLVLFGESEKPFDSYRVKFTSDGGLMVPFMEFDDYAAYPILPLTGKLLFIEAGDTLKSESFPSEYSVSSSKQKDGFLALEKFSSNSVQINSFTKDGTIIDKLPGVYFADFTESGHLMYIQKGTLYFRKRNKIDSFKVQQNIGYAYADGDQSHAIATVRRDSVFIVNLSTKAVTGIKGTLIGCDFKSKRFVSKQVIRKDERKSPADTLVLRSFDGRVLNQFATAEGIESFVYNIDSGCTLLLSKKDDKSGYQYLYLLDRDLNIRSCFGLTPNDTYGISGNGKKIYYLRDNYLSIFNNDTTLRNLQDYNALHQWIESKKQFKIHDSDVVNYKLIFPKERIWRIFGYRN